jgi:RRXRR protein
VFVPVVDRDQKPLMPTTPARARKCVTSGKATPFWKGGVFCVRLNVGPSVRTMQPIAVGIDPGSKKEAFTVKSRAHTYLNIQADAVTWVKDRVETRRNARRARRARKTPCRQPRANRARGSLPPSTKARWQWKLRILAWLRKMFPIAHVIVEDIKATTKGKKRWDQSFSPLEVGKQWFYQQIANLTTKRGWETKQMRDAFRLSKSGNKMSERFEAHCVDSWVLANSVVDGPTKPDNTEMLMIIPLEFHRRQLHVFNPKKGGIRRAYGGTRSMGFKRGSLVTHHRYGLCYVGGSSRGRISLHALETGKRLTQGATTENIRFRCFNSWRTRGGPHSSAA